METNWTELLNQLTELAFAYGWGVPIILFCLMLIIVPLFGFVVRWRIMRKTGYSGLLTFFWCLPIIGFLVSIFLAYTNWPVARRGGKWQ